MNLNDKIKLTKKINKLKKVELIHLIEAFINLDEIKNLNNNKGCINCSCLDRKLNNAVDDDILIHLHNLLVNELEARQGTKH